ILFVSITARLDADLQQTLIGQVHSLAGPEAAKTVAAIVHGAKSQTRLTSLAGIFGMLTLLISASLIFGQLRATLNRILEIKPRTKTTATLRQMTLEYLRGKLLQILIAVAFILLMVASVLVSTVITALSVIHHGPLALFANAAFSALIYVV